MFVCSKDDVLIVSVYSFLAETVECIGIQGRCFVTTL